MVPVPSKPCAIKVLPVPDRTPSIEPPPLTAVKSFWIVGIPAAVMMILTVVTPAGAKATVLAIAFTEGVQTNLAVMPPIDLFCDSLVPQLTNIAREKIIKSL
jgi:hypothetical protein